MKKMGLGACLDAAFEHYVLFVDEFELVSEKALEPLKERTAKVREEKRIALRLRAGSFGNDAEAFI